MTLQSHSLLRICCMLISLIAIAGCSSTQNELSLNEKRYGHAVVNDSKKIFVFAGSNRSGFLGDVEIIDPSTGHIEVLSNHVIPRRYFSAVWDGNQSIYLIGGISRKDGVGRLENRVEVFNTKTYEVTQAKPIPSPTRINTAVWLNDRIYVIGGTEFYKRRLTPSAQTLSYNPKLDEWSKHANMPTAKTTRAVAKDGYIYTIGGYDRWAAINVFERYDPDADQWHTLDPLPFNVSAHSATILGDDLYIFGDYKRLTATYSYNFTTQKWKNITIGYKASRHNAATTIDDTIYVIGGNVAGNGPFLDYIQKFSF